MQPAALEISTCPACGRVLEETSGGGRGCMVCLLRVEIDDEDEVADDSTVEVFEGAQHLGVYEIDRHEDGSLYELGHGAMGTTYRATDTTLQRKVALKIVRIAGTEPSHEPRERFLREARAAATLRHENIATVFQFGIREETGHLFYAMELIEGETLEERVRRAGPLDVRTTIGIAQQVTAALIAAEKRGVIHRDLKPANLMLVDADEVVGTDRRAVRAQQRPGPTAKIIDLGLAKALNTPADPTHVTHHGFVGTPAFASPEQFEDSALDVRSDIYSLGATLWFALTGKTPFAGRSVEEIHRAQQSDALPIEQLKAARVPSRLRSLLKSMLALEPAARPGIQDLAARLQRCSAQARPTRAALAVGVILIFGVSAFSVFPILRTANRPVPTAEHLVSNPVPPEKSIAVLPFENASNEPNTEYLSEGISAALINSLSELQQLRVIARPTAFRYKRKDVDPRQVARELGVAAVLTGKVRQMQDALTVQVDLVDAATGAQIWGAAYDRNITDLLAVKQAIAQEVTAKLKLKLSSEEQRRLVKRDSTNAEAYQFYLRGRYFWNKRTSDGIK